MVDPLAGVAAFGDLQGLGYYRPRGQSPLACRRSCGNTRGRIPSDPDPLLTTPGRGRCSTAGAVASFAYERCTPAVDTNVARVLRRAFHPRLGGSGSHRRLWEHGRRNHAPTREHGLGVQSGDHWELGALVCTAEGGEMGSARCGSACAYRAAALARGAASRRSA